MTVTEQVGATEPFLEELDAWITANWDPDLTVGEWWERLGLAGWSAPTLPEGSFGRGLSPADGLRVHQTIAARGALGPPAGLGLLLAAPTIARHGTPEQVDLYVRDIVTGQKAWCQLFSEPAAGSDLAGLQTSAVRDGDEWVINGQKVWTSGAHHSDLGMLLARSNPGVPKHQGISYFGFPMHQDGVEVRPLREMTGRALFNEVFLTDARVPNSALIGGVDNGWAVANTTLLNERSGLGAGGGSAAFAFGAQPGTVLGHLGRRAGDFVGGRRGKRTAPPSDGANQEAGGLSTMSRGSDFLIQFARGGDSGRDPLIRQDLARLHILSELGRFNTLRLKAARQAGRDIPGMPNIAKLAMSRIIALSRDVGLRMVGAAGMLHGYNEEDRQALAGATGNPFVAMVTETTLLSPAPSIYGGTDQIQRNIIGERVLGLPKEPGSDRNVPFSDLPKNV